MIRKISFQSSNGDQKCDLYCKNSGGVNLSLSLQLISSCHYNKVTVLFKNRCTFSNNKAGQLIKY